MRFNEHVRPYLTTAKWGLNFDPNILYIGCQWKRLPIDLEPSNPITEIFYYHIPKWSLENARKQSILTILDDLNLSELNFVSIFR